MEPRNEIAQDEVLLNILNLSNNLLPTQFVEQNYELSKKLEVVRSLTDFSKYKVMSHEVKPYKVIDLENHLKDLSNTDQPALSHRIVFPNEPEKKNIEVECNCQAQILIVDDHEFNIEVLSEMLR